MKFTRSGVIGIVLAVLAIGGFWLTRARRQRNVHSEVATAKTESGSEAGAAERESIGAARRRPSAESRRRADELRGRLSVLRSEKINRATPPTAAERVEKPKPASRMPAPQSSGNQAQEALGKYVRSTVREQFLPMAKGCYEELLLRQPNARGKLVLDVAVGGDPSVGGVVESVKVAPESTINDESTVTCIVESMMALVFDAPPEGHDRIDFKYPFDFSPGEPDAE